MEEKVRLRKKDQDKNKSGLALSVASVEECEEENLLDFSSVSKALDQEVTLQSYYDLHSGSGSGSDSDGNDVDDEGRKSDKKKFDRPPKLNLVVGFLRLANYVCACTVIFGLMVSIFYPILPSEPQDETLFKLWQDVVYFACSWVQSLYLFFVSILVLIDSVATKTFRWKEYGELTHTQTDATSIIFFLCPSRWVFRLFSGMTMATVMSMRFTRILEHVNFSDHDLFWYFGLSLSSVASAIVGLAISFIPWHGVHWLYDQFDYKHIDDKGDVWNKSGNREAHLERHAKYDLMSAKGSTPLTKRDISVQDQVKKPKYCFSTFKTVIIVIAKLVYFTVYLISFIVHLLAVVLSMPLEKDLHFWVTVSSFLASQLLNFLAMTYVIVDVCDKSSLSNPVPFLLKILTPFCLSSACRAFIDIDPEIEKEGNLFAWKSGVAYLWMFLVLICCLCILIEFSLRLLPLQNVWTQTQDFLCKNLREDGVNKKTIRFLDTLGSILALTALVLGICSLFIDQYDLVWTPEDILKDFAQAIETFQTKMKPVTDELANIVEKLDKQFTCQEVYKAIGTGTAVTLFASFFPGASSMAQVGSKSAYYGVRAANAFTNLARKMRKSMSLMWQVSKVLYGVQKFLFGNMKKLIIGSNSISLIKLLPFLPPVVLGVYVLFGAFWPQRILFFSAVQRRRTMGSMLYSRILAIVVMSVAIAINTALVDEVVGLINDNIPLVGVEVERKLGWHLSVVAFGLSFSSLFCFVVAALILRFQTFQNHQNITNEELDWKYELEKRELVTVRTGIGNKIEKKTQIKYKKERIGPWTWVLPCLLCLAACGFSYLANVHPKLEFQLEPKGSFGRLINRIDREHEKYENHMNNIKEDTDKECLPYTSFNDMLAEQKYSNILMNPVNRFFNATENLIKPVKDIFRGLRKQLLLDIQDELFGDTLNNIWNENNLQYIGLLLMIPRFICLLILIFGMLTANIWTCQMRIFEFIEPKKLVDAYGKVALFSAIYVLGTQFALFNLITSFGIPFYHINLKFGLGFIYDLVAEFILMSVYIGMNNEFFFAIPKKKVTVTYHIPGVSDGGPNPPGKII